MLTKSNKHKNVNWSNEKTPAEFTSQCVPFSESVTLVIPETQKSSESLFLRKSLSTPELLSTQPPMPQWPVKHLEDDWKHNIALLPNLMKEMEETKRFTKDWAWNNTPKDFWGKNENYSNNDNSPVLLEILKNHMCNLQKEHVLQIKQLLIMIKY